jgi:hypothetical protein
MGVLYALGMAASVLWFGGVVLNNRRAVGQPATKGRSAASPALSARQPKLRATFEGEKGGTAVALSDDGRVLVTARSSLWLVGGLTGPMQRVQSPTTQGFVPEFMGLPWPRTSCSANPPTISASTATSIIFKLFVYGVSVALH